MKAKIYKIEKTHKGRTTVIEDTLPNLIKYFSYTLECGKSWNPKINDNPKSGKGLVSSLEKCVEELQGGCFDRDSYTLIE